MITEATDKTFSVPLKLIDKTYSFSPIRPAPLFVRSRAFASYNLSLKVASWSVFQFVEEDSQVNRATILKTSAYKLEACNKVAIYLA